MSGNPFRRVQTNRSSEYETLYDPIPRTNNSTTKKKKVTIQTPPQSPEEVPRRLSAGRVSPPPPKSNDEGDSDSTATAESDLEQTTSNTSRNSGSLQPPSNPGASVKGAPYNPFARTLASNEAAFGLQQTREGQPELEREHGAEVEPRAGAGRPALNMDQFKNILMTGSPAPKPPLSKRPQPLQDSSSSTTTSSVSRTSLFDQVPFLEPGPETPSWARTSFDHTDSPASSEGEESSGLMTGSERLDDFAPPAPPKHSHGRQLGPRGPQTVSFADFEESIPSSNSKSNPQTESVDPKLGGALRPAMMSRSPSDLNKPLPPPPQEAEATEKPTSSVPETIQAPSLSSIPTVASTADASQLKKAPPPPPASRRTVPVALSQGRAHSSSNASQQSTEEHETLPQSSTQESNAKSSTAPRPPPSRKLKPTSQTTTPALDTPPKVASPAPSVTEIKQMPPPPPRRTASKVGSSVNRTSSSASHSSVSRNEVTQSSGNNAPPAPPPRRGVNLKWDSTDGVQNSMAWAVHGDNSDGRRSSSTSIGSGRFNSHSNLRQIVEPVDSEQPTNPSTESAPRSDILADMAAFQAEIEKLRGQTTGDG